MGGISPFLSGAAPFPRLPTSSGFATQEQGLRSVFDRRLCGVLDGKCQQGHLHSQGCVDVGPWMGLLNGADVDPWFVVSFRCRGLFADRVQNRDRSMVTLSRQIWQGCRE